MRSFGDWLALTLALNAVLAAIDIFYIVLAEFARRHMSVIHNSRLVGRCSAVALASAAVMIAAQ